MITVLLDEVEVMGRDEDGRIYAWRGKNRLGEFENANQAIDYLDAEWQNIKDLELRFFSGSASLLGKLNAYIDAKKGGLL